MKRRAAGLVLVAAVGLAAGAAVSPVVFAVVVVAVAGLSVWVWPRASLELGALLVLSIRPWVDVFSERRAGLGPFAVNPSVLIGLAILVIAALEALRRRRAGLALWPDRRLAGAHGFLVAAYAVACVSGARLFGLAGAGMGAREAVRVASIIGALLVVFWWADGFALRQRRGWVYLIVGVAVPVVVAVWQYVTGTGYLETEGLNRLQGTLSHPNAFGQYLLPFVLLSVNGAASTQGSRRVVFLAAALSVTWLIVQSYSRTALLALGAGLIALALLRARRISVRVVVQTLLIVGLVGGVSAYLAREALRERFANVALGRSAIESAMSGAAENSFEWRLVNWGVLISMGLAHPLAGYGAGMTTVLNPIVNTDNGVPYNAHNDFVRFFFESGLLGLAAYLLYAIGLCGWSIRNARASPDLGSPAFAVAASCLTLLLLSAGNPEISLATASLYSLNGMLALQATGQAGRTEPTA